MRSSMMKAAKYAGPHGFITVSETGRVTCGVARTSDAEATRRRDRS